MTTVENYDFPDDLYYTKDHVWVKVEGNKAVIGLTQFGQKIAGDILFVEAPNPGRVVAKDEAFMSMESGKWVGRVKSPLTGKIAEANPDLEWETGLVNSDPYGKGWLTKLEVSNPQELEGLFRSNSAEFRQFIAEEEKKYKK